MFVGHLKVWKKSHTFVWDIYNYFLQCTGDVAKFPHIIYIKQIQGNSRVFRDLKGMQWILGDFIIFYRILVELLIVY